MKRFTQLTCIAALVAASTVAVAQSGGYTGPSANPAANSANASAAKPAPGAYTGPSSVQLMSAKDLLAKGKDDQAVRLKGRLVSHKGGDEYEFADQSGKITVEIDARLFPSGTNVDHNTEVELMGEFDKETFGESKLDVDQLRIVGR